jgi:hypothetical protein
LALFVDTKLFIAHMPKSTPLDQPNWLLPSNLVKLRLVGWAHNQPIKNTMKTIQKKSVN